MHVLLVSACEKRAIKKTRALLDSYAIRVGEKTWASPMTQEGLGEVRSALKRIATRQTAVACYRNDGRKRMKLLWIVGSRSAFGPNGHFPAGTQKKKTPSPSWTPVWVRLACQLAHASGLAHDFGKASKHFQAKLDAAANLRDDVRHEWLSLKLLQSLRKNGFDWDASWKSFSRQLDGVTLDERTVDPDRPEAVSSAVEAIDFLVATHHHLLEAENNGPRPYASYPTTSNHDRFIRKNPPSEEHVQPAGSIDPAILKEYAALEKKIQDRMEELTRPEAGVTPKKTLPQKSEPLSGDLFFWRALLVYARAALIFADHTVSAVREKQPGTPSWLYANTASFNSRRGLNQLLNTHLSSVGSLAGKAVWNMAQLVAPKQGRSHIYEPMPGLSEESVERITAPSDPASRFAWQNRSANTLKDIHDRYPDCSALVFNMASTGSGKTRMNARAACLLSREETPRISIALNLRSLTLQTGDALAAGLAIGKDELSTVIGDRTIQQMHENAGALDKNPASTPVENTDENRDEPEIDCIGTDHFLPQWLEPFFTRERERLVLSSPLLVSTIDFLIAAGNPDAQGHHVKALLRLMSADLVLDEIDSYDPNALIAVLRLVQTSALFRRNVICSSATLSLPVAKALDNAYRSGVALRHALETAGGEEQKDDLLSASYIRAFIDDELAPGAVLVHCEETSFEEIYQSRLHAMAEAVQKKPVYRLATIQPVSDVTASGWLAAIREAVSDLHTHHAWAYGNTGKRVSFGLVRVANIRTAMETARQLAEAMPHARVACYHANEWLITRFYKEQRLDRLLSRHGGNGNILDDREIAGIVREAPSNDIPFIVVATPVEEIGRDHDFDWGVIEPSSVQSIVQTAGRINRHRLVPCDGVPNITILPFNCRYCRTAETGRRKEPVFVYPGYELRGDRYRYSERDINNLLPWERQEGKPLLRIDSRLRFDTSGCTFARLDDRTIDGELSLFFGDDGCFVSPSVHCWLMTDDPYTRTPLREFTWKEPWRMLYDDGTPRFERREKIAHSKTGFITEEWLSRKMYESARFYPNAWLFLAPAEMVERCHAAQIAPEEGMRADLAVYPSKTAVEFEYDPCFGLCRISNN